MSDLSPLAWAPEQLPPASQEDDSLPRDQTYEPWISPKKQEVFIPITGFAWFYPEEIEIINHPAFQRLSAINQLGQAYFVYRGATHKRIEHCLGVVAVAQKIISAIRKNAANQELETGKPSLAHLSYAEERFVRLGALLHDIGHLAAGHTLEDELGLIGLHDGDERLDLVFDKVDWPGFEWEDHECESLRAKVDRLFARWMPSDLHEEGLSPTDVVRLLVRKPPKVDDPYIGKERVLKKSSSIRFLVCTNMIGNTICADLLDYLYRDWYHVGRSRSLNDRIFQYMEIRGADNSGLWHSSRSERDTFVISLGRAPRIRTDGVSAILGLLEARYELAEAVLFHRTKLAAGAMLDRALFELFEGEGPEYIVKRLMHLSDEELLDECAAEAAEKFKRRKDERYRISALILGRLRSRRLYSGFLTVGYNDLPDSDRAGVMSIFSGAGMPRQAGAKNRTGIARALEEDFGLKGGSIAICCVEVKPKIAQVMISVDGRLNKFADLEDDPKYRNMLAGGHLAAQVDRFYRLAKIHFFIAREERERISEEKLAELRNFVKSAVVSTGADLRHAVRDRAAAMFLSEYQGQSNSVSFDPNGEAGDATYPNGAPRITNFIRKLDELAVR